MPAVKNAKTLSSIKRKEEGQKDERNRCWKVTALFKELVCSVNALLALLGFSWRFAGAIWATVGFRVAVMSLLHNLLSTIYSAVERGGGVVEER